MVYSPRVRLLAVCVCMVCVSVCTPKVVRDPCVGLLAVVNMLDRAPDLGVVL